MREQPFFKSVYFYTACNYIDKGLIFGIPFLLLYFSFSTSLYNSFEYVYSIAKLFAIFADLGIKNYLFYGYKNSSSREVFLDKSKEVYGFLLSFYFFVILLFLFVGRFLDFNIEIVLLLLIVVRTLFQISFSYFSALYRLQDAPSKAFIITIGANAFTIVIIAFMFVLSMEKLWLLFISQAAFLFFLFFKGKHKFTDEILAFLKSSIRFRWPIIASVGVITMVNNFGKIYAFQQLSELEMFHLSVLQRGSMVVTILHASLVGFYSKSIFVDDANSIQVSILKKYSLFLASGILGAAVIVFFIDRFYNPFEVKLFGFLFVLILLFTIIWCFSAFFELYFHRINKQKFLLFSSLLAGLIYLGTLFLFKLTLSTLIFAMLVYIVSYFVLVIYGLYKFKIGFV